MVKVYYNGDIKENVLAGKTVAVIGYGSQGHAHALNLKESGVDVIVGVRQGKSFTQAQEDGHKVFSVKEAAAQAEIIMVLLPDESKWFAYSTKNVKPSVQAITPLGQIAVFFGTGQFV